MPATVHFQNTAILLDYILKIIQTILKVWKIVPSKLNKLHNFAPRKLK